jgi:hypothetical protein
MSTRGAGTAPEAACFSPRRAAPPGWTEPLAPWPVSEESMLPSSIRRIPWCCTRVGITDWTATPTAAKLGGPEPSAGSAKSQQRADRSDCSHLPCQRRRLLPAQPRQRRHLGSDARPMGIGVTVLAIDPSQPDTVYVGWPSLRFRMLSRRSWTTRATPFGRRSREGPPSTTGRTSLSTRVASVLVPKLTSAGTPGKSSTR